METRSCVTDANGKAVVNLPGYFSSINKDFKYQLTIIDETQFALARISKKINGNSFEIMTDKPNIEVSWQVTAVRNDKAMQQSADLSRSILANKKLCMFLARCGRKSPLMIVPVEGVISMAATAASRLFFILINGL